MKIRLNRNRTITIRKSDTVAAISFAATKAGLLPSQIQRLIGLVQQIRRQAADAHNHTTREANLALAARCGGSGAVWKAARLEKAAAAAARGRAGELFGQLDRNFPNVRYVG